MPRRKKVWPVIQRFDAAAEWLPFVKSSPIDGLCSLVERFRG
jgi:hypothetical protein